MATVMELLGIEWTNAVRVSDHRAAWIDIDHFAGDTRNRDRIADAVLVLDQDEHPVDDVADEQLGAEAERHADDADTGDEGRDVEPEFAQDDSHRDEHQDDGEAPVERADEGLGGVRRPH